MSKNSYSEFDYACMKKGISLDCCTTASPIRKKNMNDHKFHVDYFDFKTLEEATKYARKQTMRNQEDTVIRQDVAVVRFPVPDYEVETLTA